MKPPLQTPLGDLLDDEGDPEALERVRRRLKASRRLPRRDLRTPMLAAAAVLVVLVGGWFALRGDEGGPLALADGTPLETVPEGRRVLTDGSALTVFDDATLDTIENDGERVLFVQGAGRVHYDIVPGGPRRWSIDAGALTVDVLGTAFTVERDGARVRVDVERGRVRVRGASVPGGTRALTAGQHVEVGAPEVASVEPEVRPEVPEPATEPEASPAEPTPAEAAEEPASERAPVAPRWRALADRGQHRRAFDALGGARGLEGATARASGVEELFALADTARLSGHPDLAVAPLERLLQRHGRSSRAPMAALTLGRLQLDALNRPADAARSLERALAGSLPARLRETAMARAVEAHARAGDATRAAVWRARYLHQYPDGRYATRMREER